ncbi:MAG TPA: tRNA preQ1(34) S-adenosylmethionine ribosyltransferase-isomerase QueA [Candidatus Omnitrophica bacterium]|nr:tRNA preQ1(34) S-adenosylmethionine ribosyltransferase-isomerase QueA [Candidatus Omnitrophota bacterium]
MKLSDFDYNLPKELIAQHPAKERGASRLLVLDRKKKTISHRKFSDIADYLLPNDLVILNNTKVLPARIFGIREKTGGKLEFLLVKKEENNVFSVMIRPSKKFVENETILFKNSNGGFKGRMVDRNKIAFDLENIDDVYKIGTMPLPPYIKRESDILDFQRYQTVFAEESGSIAAPTAGLHFTKRVLADIIGKGVDINYVTLHVGIGTFKPVKTEDVNQHIMHKEYFSVEADVLARVVVAKENKNRVFAVGTTTCRSLEALASQKIQSSFSGWTDLFILPGYKFKAVDSLLTNFHLPKTTLFMLVSAFAGDELIKQAYKEAIDQKYRFYSYGDAMLIL